MNRIPVRAIILSSLLLISAAGRAEFRSVSVNDFIAMVTFGYAFPEDPISLEANYIVNCQIRTQVYGAGAVGCINNVVPNDGPTQVLSRENATAVLGLVEAYNATASAEFKRTALLCTEYLKKRQDVNDGGWCREYDEKNDTWPVESNKNKSPAEAGSAILAFYKVKDMGWEDTSHQYYDSARRAADYIIACIDNKQGEENGLAGTGKEYGSGSYNDNNGLGTYQWGSSSWISDNCYAYLGLACMKKWAQLQGDATAAAKYDTYAQGVLNGINARLKNPNNAVWYRVVDLNGQPFSESLKKDNLCYYPQELDMPVPQYGSLEVAAWVRDNILQMDNEGYGAIKWGETSADPGEFDRLSQGLSERAWLSLVDIPGDIAKTIRQALKAWWESEDNTNGRGRLWDTLNGGIIDWFDPDGVPAGYLAPEWQKCIGTSANCILTYRGGFNHNLGTVYSPNLHPAVVSHRGVDHMSAVTGIAIATGTVTDDIGVKRVSVYYYLDTNPAVSSATVTVEVPHTTAFDFSVEMPVSDKNAKYLYYCIEAVDSSDNRTFWPNPAERTFKQVTIDSVMTASLGMAGGTVVLGDGNPQDGETAVSIPLGALDSSVTISIEEVNPADSTIVPKSIGRGASIHPLAIYRFGPDGTVFKKSVQMKLLYQDVDQDGIVDGTRYREAFLRIFWWDGMEWRMVGGKIDPIANVVSAEVQHFSTYGIFPVTAQEDDEYRAKEKIITPVSIDMINDYATFGGLTSGDLVNIYDVTGRKIRQLKETFIWDGKDENDNFVESGLYIYQIKTAGKTISGTIVVAR